MIDDQVVNVAGEFKFFWTRLFMNYPRYQLDYSWPSISLLDLYFSNLKGRTDYSEEEIKLINGAAAYIAIILYDIWKFFPEAPNISITATGANNNIEIQVFGIKYTTRKEPYKINLSKALLEILSNPQNPFPCFSDFSRQITPESNTIGLFVLGAAAALSPYGEGKLKDENYISVSTNIFLAQGLLAESSAKYYQRTVPFEPIGAKPTLYAHGLIYPPTGFKEEYDLRRAVNGFINFYTEEKIDYPALQILTHNLALSPDERISDTGLVISLAIAEPPGSDDLRLLVQSKITKCLKLRPAIICARDLLNRPANWFTLMREERDAEPLFNLEHELGLLPLFILPFDFCRKKELETIVLGLTWGAYAETRKLIDNLSKQRELEPELILQGVYLDIALNKPERAEQELSKLKQHLASDSRFSGIISSIEGMAKCTVKDYLNAETLLSTAIEYNITDRTILKHTYEYLVYVLYKQQKYDLALMVYEKAKEDSALTLNTLLTHCQCYHAMGDLNQLQKELDPLIRKVPMDRKVFLMLFKQYRP